MRQATACVAVALGLACAGAGTDRKESDGSSQAVITTSPTTEKAPAAEPAAEPAGPPRRGVALITDPVALAVIEKAGLSLTRLVSPADWKAITKTIAADIQNRARGDSRAGVGIRGNAHRLFDRRWLSSAKTRFELVGVTYRVDRIPVTPGQCGDIRLIYRLAYTIAVGTRSASSRLPMTVAVVLKAPPVDPESGCRDAARRWHLPTATVGAELGQAMVSGQGPLANVSASDVSMVLSNLQVVRWPSAVRPDLGGHAEYALRSFKRVGGTLKPAPLDNTPDVRRIARNKKLRSELLEWIRLPATLAAIEEGRTVLPENLAAQSALSVAPRGFSRRANRLFRQLVGPKDLAGLSLAGRRHSGSAQALLRRLDEQTCVGCHQARTIAGFHLLGEDAADVVPGNALAVSSSPHLLSEAKRRAQLIESLAGGGSPSFVRPSVERDASDKGESGSRCGLGDPGFSSWTCASNHTCIPYDNPKDDNAVGVCVASGSSAVGEPCEFGPLRANRNPHRDRDPKSVKRACSKDAVCNTNRVGFPGGMCTDGCDPLPAGGACGVIALLGPFNACLARRQPFPECLRQHVAPAGMRACDASHPCREDYICSRTPDGAGACTPPYFLFQLRVDGHRL